MGKKWILILKGIAGTPGRIRTCDLLLRRRKHTGSEGDYDRLRRIATVGG